MTRVLHVISEMKTGGAEVVVRELALRGNGVHAVGSSGGRHADDLKNLGIETFFVPATRRSVRRSLGAMRAVRSTVLSFDPTVVIAHNVAATLVCWITLRLMRRKSPIVAVFHGLANSDYRLGALMLRAVRVQVVAVSTAISHRLVDNGVASSAVTVIPNAAPETARVSGDEVRRELGVGDDALVVSVARMVPQKRQDLLLHAWANGPARGRLVLVGDGPTRSELERLADDLGIQDYVKFLGERQDVPELLSAADVFVLSTDWEGLPISLLEALSAGLPVVASDVDGVSDVLQYGGGILVPAGSVAPLGEALQKVLTDDQLRRQLSLEARQVVDDYFSLDRMVQSYDELVREVGGRQQ